MELKDILSFIKDYGYTPVLLSLAILYFIRNKDDILKLIADRISTLIQNNNQKMIEKAENEILIKDIQILELFLSKYVSEYFNTILTTYNRYKESINEHTEDFKAEIKDYFKKDRIFDLLESLKIRKEITTYYQNEVQPSLLDSFQNRLYDIISMNGKSNLTIFETLLKDILDNLVKQTTDYMEKKFLYPKL